MTIALIILCAYLWILAGLFLATAFMQDMRAGTAGFLFMLLFWPFLITLTAPGAIFRNWSDIRKKRSGHME